MSESKKVLSLAAIRSNVQVPLAVRLDGSSVEKLRASLVVVETVVQVGIRILATYGEQDEPGAIEAVKQTMVALSIMLGT